uniref:Uncharacterized protein n=1 Tax=Euplotes harpa TaxID=151035 RepID=A0A7S3J2B4_9SPIT|mmetsp:Transcript_11047/g.12423  ORF Transcript_11047/g.12423 Transcript_11047/m.12423 type:complete len:193 (+) Transcript_11047:26-604(+)
MAYSYEYGGNALPQRPGASRRTRDADFRSRAFDRIESQHTSVDSMRHSSYNPPRDSYKLNRSTSSGKQHSYKLDQIHNKLAERNNPLMSFYKENKNSRINTANRNNDSSNFKRNIEKYGLPVSDSQRSAMKIVNESEERQLGTRDSRVSTKDQAQHSSALRQSGLDLIKASKNKRAESKPLDVIYENPYDAK